VFWIYRKDGEDRLYNNEEDHVTQMQNRNASGSLRAFKSDNLL